MDMKDFFKKHLGIDAIFNDEGVEIKKPKVQEETYPAAASDHIQSLKHVSSPQRVEVQSPPPKMQTPQQVQSAPIPSLKKQDKE